MSKVRNIRKRRAVDEEDEGDGAGPEQAQAITAEEIKLLQKQRQLKKGVTATALAGTGNKLPAVTAGPSGPTETATADVLKASFSRGRKQYTEEDDPEMKRFIEQELARRLGRQVPEDEAGGQRGRLQKSIEDVAMEAAAPKQKAFDADPGAAFVAGVAEVPLDVAHRLKNIEATEAAKAALLRKGHAPGLYDDDEDGEGASGGLRRGQFPVRFGRQSAKEAALLQEVAAKKAQARERAAEKKRLKAKEFAGW